MLEIYELRSIEISQLYTIPQTTLSLVGHSPVAAS